MPRFSYTAVAQDKTIKRGSVSADSAYLARKHLRAKGLHPTEVREIVARKEARSLTAIFRKSGKTQVAEFTRQLSTMLRAGIKLTEALSVLAQQVSEPRLKGTVTDIRDRVITGESFTEAIAEYGDYFDPLYVSMTRVGEVTGTLPESLSSISVFMEKRRKVESKMITAMIYPVILLVVCIIAVVVLTIKVIPPIAEQFAKTGQELPLITKVMMAVSDMLTSWWGMVVLAVIVFMVLAARRFLRTPRGAYLRDKTTLSLPVFGPLIRQRIVARFTSTLSTLLGAGLSMADSLKVVAEVTNNTIMNNAVRQARERILSGADIATPLRDSGVIDLSIAHMVAVGEKSGELETMLRTISENLESSSDIVIERLSAAIEPVIIVFMAVIVGMIALAALLPILELTSAKI